MITKFIFKYIKYKNVKMPGVTIQKNNKKISQLTSIDSQSYLSSISAYSWVPIATYIDDYNPTTYTNYKVNLSTILNSSYEISKEFITSYVAEKVDYSYNAITTLSDLNTINDNPISKGLDKRYVQKVDIVIQDLDKGL